MHPILKDRGTLVLYLLAWLAPGVLLAALLSIPGEVSWFGALLFSLPMMLVYAFMSLSTWYVCRAFPLQGTDLAKVLTALSFAAVLSCAFWMLVCYGWATGLNSLRPGLAPREKYPESAPLIAALGVGLFFLTATVNYLIAAFESARLTERNALELQVLARDAELKALRAQIDPHFLFNSLNSISALTATNPADARTMTLMLAEFLRQSMSYGALETITLDQEISLVLHFLDIERVRFGNRLTVDVSILDATRSCRVPPLLLQPLVENAVNHGVAHLLEGGTLRLVTERIGKRLRIIIENPIDPDQPKASGNGVGLVNVRSRLHRIYGAEGRMDVEIREGRFIAVISLPLRW